MKFNMLLVALIGLVLYLCGGEAILHILLSIRYKVFDAPTVAPSLVHILFAFAAFGLWTLGWVHDTISGGNVGIPWIAGFPLNLPFPTGTYWEAPWIMQVNEISVIPQTTHLYGDDDEGMDVSVTGIGNVAGQVGTNSIVSFKVKASVIWKVYDPYKFFLFLELNWGDETEWDAAKKKAEDRFIPKVLEFIRTSAAKTSYTTLIQNHLQDEHAEIQDNLNHEDVEVINGLGIQVRELAISKVVPTDESFAKLLAGGAVEAEEAKKEGKDLTTFNALLKQAQDGLVAQGWTAGDSATQQESLRIVREVQLKQAPAQRFDISGLGEAAKALAQLLAARGPGPT